jgi:hypothetical protein
VDLLNCRGLIVRIVEEQEAGSPAAMNVEELKPNTIVRGPVFPEPVKVIRIVSVGNSIKLIGQGMTTGMVHQPILSPAQVASLQGTPDQAPFDGDATKFKLGIEALRDCHKTTESIDE